MTIYTKLFTPSTGLAFGEILFFHKLIVGPNRLEMIPGICFVTAVIVFLIVRHPWKGD
jgi:hypothetical protein